MKEGDVITAINGKPINHGNQLVGTVASTPLGTALSITVEREGKRHDLKVVVADLAQMFPEQYGNGRQDLTKNGEPTTVKFGMQIQNLTDQQADRLGIKQKAGVQVKAVEPGSFAEDIGLQAGDVIVAINRQTVNSTDDIGKFGSSLKPGDAVQFRVLSKGPGNDWSPRYAAGMLPSSGR
jgi:serine protease Do